MSTGARHTPCNLCESTTSSLFSPQILSKLKRTTLLTQKAKVATSTSKSNFYPSWFDDVLHVATMAAVGLISNMWPWDLGLQPRNRLIFLTPVTWECPSKRATWQIKAGVTARHQKAGPLLGTEAKSPRRVLTKQAHAAPLASQPITGKCSCKTSDLMLRKEVIDCNQWWHFADLFLFLVAGVTRCQRCLTIHYTVQWQNHTAEARTKSIPRGITSHPQITCLEPPKPQTGNVIDPPCPPRVTAPSPAPRTDCSLPVLAPPLPQCRRNQWCLRAQREGWVTIGLLYLLNVPRHPNPGTTERALKFLLNSGHLQGLANHSPTETVRKTFVSYLSSRVTYCMQTLVLL